MCICMYLCTYVPMHVCVGSIRLDSTGEMAIGPYSLRQMESHGYCIHAYMYVCMYVCMHDYMYLCVYVCMYVCMYLCIYVCLCRVYTVRLYWRNSSLELFLEWFLILITTTSYSNEILVS